MEPTDEYELNAMRKVLRELDEMTTRVRDPRESLKGEDLVRIDEAVNQFKSIPFDKLEYLSPPFHEYPSFEEAEKATKALVASLKSPAEEIRKLGEATAKTFSESLKSSMRHIMMAGGEEMTIDEAPQLTEKECELNPDGDFIVEVAMHLSDWKYIRKMLLIGAVNEAFRGRDKSRSILDDHDKPSRSDVYEQWQLFEEFFLRPLAQSFSAEDEAELIDPIRQALGIDPSKVRINTP